MMRKGLATFALSMAVAITGHALEPELISVKHSGLGGAGVAYPQDSLSIVLNPASSAQLCNRFDLGLHWKWTNSTFSVNDTVIGALPVTTRYKNHDEHIVHPDFAVNYWLGCDISFGLAFHNSFHAKFDANAPIFGFTLLGEDLEHKLMIETITPVLAWRFCNCHTIGIGLPIYLSAYKNSGLDSFAVGGLSIDPAHVTNNGWDHSTGWGINFGYLLQLMPNVDFGIFYQPKVSMKRHFRYRGFIADGGKIDIPEIVRAGFVYKDDCWNLAFDVEHRSYSELDFWGNSFLVTPTDFGSSDGPGLGWSNQTIFRVGADYRWDASWILRTGVETATVHNHGEDAFFSGVFGKAVTTTLSVGLTWVWDCDKEVSAYYAHGFKRKLHSEPFGIAETVTRDIEFEEDTNYLGISFGMHF